MGTKQLIILFIGSLLLTACFTDTATVNPDEETQEKIPVTLKIVFENAGETRATEEWKYDDFFPGIFEKEKKVSNVLVIAFKNRLLEEYKYYEEVDLPQQDSSIVLGEDEEEVFDLEPGAYYFYAILNMPAPIYQQVMILLEEKEGVLTREDFEREVLTASLEELTDESNGFMMTNKESPTIRGIYSEEQQKENSNLHNRVEIKVGRAVGKISFAYVASEVQTGELHGSLSEVQYQLFHNPKQMHLMPVKENDILLTPHYEGNYGSDYFYPTVSDIKEEEWLPATTIHTSIDPDDRKYEYCIENHNKSSLKSNSTMLLIRAKFTPAVWSNKDNTVGSPNNDGTFWRIGHFNANDVLYAYTQGYYNEAPSQEVINELNNNKLTNSGYYASVKYEKGITYYGFWPGNNGRHQVKRNDYYKIAITHIHGAGAPEPGETVDPDVDPDDEKTTGRLAAYAVSWEEEYMELIVGSDPVNDDEMKEGEANFKPSPWDEEEQEETLKGGDGDNQFN